MRLGGKSRFRAGASRAKALSSQSCLTFSYADSVVGFAAWDRGEGTSATGFSMNSVPTDRAKPQGATSLASRRGWR